MDHINLRRQTNQIHHKTFKKYKNIAYKIHSTIQHLLSLNSNNHTKKTSFKKVCYTS